MLEVKRKSSVFEVASSDLDNSLTELQAQRDAAQDLIKETFQVRFESLKMLCILLLFYFCNTILTFWTFCRVTRHTLRCARKTSSRSFTPSINRRSCELWAHTTCMYSDSVLAVLAVVFLFLILC